MRIGIDARFLTHPQNGGFKTYTENLITALAEIDQKNTYFLYLDRIPDEKTRLPQKNNLVYRVINGRNPIFGMFLREQFGLPFWAAKDKLDLLHSPCLSAPLHLKCASVVTIHDMIWYSLVNNSMKSHNSIKKKFMNWYYYIVTQHAALNASAILTVSQASKDCITQILGIPSEKVFVTHEASNPIFHQVLNRKQTFAIRRKYDLPCDYIMAIGSADPRKNVSIIFKAFAQLPASTKANYQLVIIWTNSLLAEKLMKHVVELGLDKSVRFIAHVSNEDLVLLYNEASLFVFPSLEEGFGLPPLEAMACGTPVIAADNSSIPEILGDAALLVGADDVDALACNMTQILSDPTAQAELTQKGLDRAALFSWQKCARETIEVYEQALLRK
jgi:glycosyltransferase involved in cell wall biosynthesis